jgi:hypothetical protein
VKNQGQIDAWTQEANQATQEGDHNFAYPATQLEIIGAIDLINYASDRLWGRPAAQRACSTTNCVSME